MPTIYTFHDDDTHDAAQIKQCDGDYVLRAFTAPTSRPLVLGTGQLNWNRRERVTNRYGAVGLYNDAHWQAGEDSTPLRGRGRAGEFGQLRAIVLEIRDADHVGDLTYGWHVGGAQVGDVIVLGEGILFFEDDLGPKVGVRPRGDSQELWLDGPALYRCHSQTVRLEFCPL